MQVVHEPCSAEASPAEPSRTWLGSARTDYQRSAGITSEALALAQTPRDGSTHVQAIADAEQKTRHMR